MSVGSNGRKSRAGKEARTLRNRQDLFIIPRNRHQLLRRSHLSRAASSYKKSSRMIHSVSRSRSCSSKYPLKVTITSHRSLCSRRTLLSLSTTLISFRSPSCVHETKDFNRFRISSAAAVAVATAAAKKRKPNRTAPSSRNSPALRWGRKWRTTESCGSTSPSKRYQRL